MIKNFRYIFLSSDIKHKSFLNILFLTFDFILFILFITVLYNHLIMFVSYLNEFINNFYSIDNIVNNMSPAGSSSQTTTQVIHTSDGWASGIKSIFIYGTGAIRYHFIRAGTPFQKGFVIASTIAGDAASTALKNAINDPEYVEKHLNSWTRMTKGQNNSTLELNVSKDSDTLNQIPELKSKLLPDNLNAEYISDTLINYFKELIEPVPVDYSTEILSNQIYGISIILFILSIMIFILLVSFILNIIIYVYSENLINFFTNK